MTPDQVILHKNIAQDAYSYACVETLCLLSDIRFTDEVIERNRRLGQPVVNEISERIRLCREFTAAWSQRRTAQENLRFWKQRYNSFDPVAFRHIAIMKKYAEAADA